jgi:hypothetical protein
MTSDAKTADQYVKELPAERREPVSKLREVILKSLPKGFKESMGYGMITYVVPHEIYPPGYHCDPKQALPFVSIASQKNFIAFYHMGMYMIPELLQWFQSEYPKHSTAKLDMGKSCARFKKLEHIPFKLIGELMKKVSVKEWIEVYEKNLKKSSAK